ncbi:hypothetical protein V6N11_053143 [Hibiscus sabdariffa]|uniref:Uncharacterized protein n=1 Tax=Hibiscus sabdariffa TaxID=183260 RepID=A0ABR2UC80_9ROSI
MEASLAALNISDGEDEPLLVQGETNVLDENLALCLVGWLLEQDCEEIIQQFWRSSTDPLPKKLENLGKELQSWGSLKRKRRRETKAVLESRLHALEDAESVSESELIFEEVSSSITSELNSVLTAPFNAEEVSVALRTMSPLKAPGLDISVWNDAWLPGKGNGRLNLPIDIRFPKVSDLIIPESNVWNYGLLQSIFPSDIAARIGCIPLARSKPCDELIWRYDNTGLYSPKSGYKLLLEMSSSQHPINVEPNAAIMLSFYKSLWELNLPAKCKIFFWRLMHNFLPTFNNLQLRRLQVRNTCRFCEAAAESVTHFALLCPITLGILDSVGCSLVPTTPQLEFCETLASWFIQSTKRDQSLIVISYWALWYARNEIIHESRPFSAVSVSSFILSFLLELESSIVVPASNSLIKDVKWFPPDGSIIKLNFDASFNSASNSSVSGIVARDSHGFILAACTCPHREIADAFIAEAVACEKAVSFALDLGFRSVQIEGDSLSVIKKLNSTAMDKSIISPIIGDIKALSVNFVSVTFSFVGRRGNVVAHELARVGLQFPEPRYWIEEAPSTVEQLAVRDCLV